MKLLDILTEDMVDKSEFVNQIDQMMTFLSFAAKGDELTSSVFKRYTGVNPDEIQDEEYYRLLYNLSPEDLAGLMHKLQGLLQQHHELHQIATKAKQQRQRWLH